MCCGARNRHTVERRPFTGAAFVVAGRFPALVARTMAGVPGRTIGEFYSGPRGRARAFLFELALALVYTLVAIAFLTHPELAGPRSPAAHVVEPFDVYWSVLYIVGAIALWVGILRPAQHVRVAGLLLLGTGLLMQFVASAWFTIEPRTFIYLVWALACLARAAAIVRLDARLR